MTSAVLPTDTARGEMDQDVDHDVEQVSDGDGQQSAAGASAALSCSYGVRQWRLDENDVEHARMIDEGVIRGQQASH